MRFKYFLIFFCLLLTQGFLYSQNIINYEKLDVNPVAVKNWKTNYSDSSSWKNAQLDDAGWTVLDNKINLSRVAVPFYWLRTGIEFTGDNSRVLSLFIVSLGGAFEVYWDGYLIDTNGKIGKDSLSEVAGKALKVIPISLNFTAKGTHTLAIRISNYSNLEIRHNSYIALGTHDQITNRITEKNTYILIIASVLFSFALFNLVLFWGFNKEISLLFLSLFSLVLSIKTVLETYYIFTNFNLKGYLFLAGFIHPLVVISGIFLVAFLVFKFTTPYTKHIILAYIVLSAGGYFLISARAFIVIMMSVASIYTLYAIYKKYEGSLLSLIGLIGFAVFSYIGYLSAYNYGYFLGIVFFVFCISISSARQISKKIYLHSQVEIRATRLESQLLKKNIQPHFILNSLSSLQELIETSPQQANEFIEALADEFRVFSQIANEKLISIRDELKICEAHLKIMGFRKEASFTLTTEGITGTEMVPPAVFHTLVENGLTHGYAKKKSGVFLLKKEMFDKEIIYTLFNDSDISKAHIPENKGTGMKYIEARLQESFPGRWSLNSCPTDNGWLVSIKIID